MLLRVAFGKGGQVVRKTRLHRQVDLLAPGLEFPLAVRLNTRRFYKPAPAKPRPLLNQPSLPLLSGNELLLFIEDCSHCSTGELFVALRELSLRAQRLGLQIKGHPWVARALQALEEQVQWLPRAHLLELYQTLDRLDYISAGLEAKLHKYLETTIHKLSEEEFMYVVVRMAQRSGSEATACRKHPHAYEYLLKSMPNRLETLRPRDLLACYFIMRE
jgi:hypothetical protein